MHSTKKILPLLLSVVSIVLLSKTSVYAQANKHFEGMLHYTIKHSNGNEKADYPNELKVHITKKKVRITAITYFGYIIYLLDHQNKTGVRLYEIYGDKYLVKIPFSEENITPDAFVEFPKERSKEIHKYNCGLVTIARPGIEYKGWFPNEEHISDDITKLAPYMPYGIIQPYKKIRNRIFFELTIHHDVEGSKTLKLKELNKDTPAENLFEYKSEDFEVVSQQKIQETLESLSDWKQH